MNVSTKLIGILFCLNLLGCSESEKKIRKAGLKEIPISIKDSELSTLSDCIISLKDIQNYESAELKLSDCIISLKVEADEILSGNESIISYWTINGETAAEKRWIL